MADVYTHYLLPHSNKTFEDSYILGEIIARGQFSTIVKCLFKGKAERACRIYKKETIKIDKVQNLEKIMKVHHPNLIQIYDAFESEMDFHLICEMISGEELFERIVECGHYSEKEAAKATSCILSALDFLHKIGIAHGDIRPESLLYQNERSDAPLKLRDVSFSKVPHNSYTAIYFAPEKEKHMGDTVEEDIWSLGIVLYIMLCGLDPGESARKLSVCGFHLPFWDNISDSAKNLLKQLLEEVPENRITAAKALESSWIKGDSTKEEHMQNTVERLKEFNAKHKFRAATKAVLATQRMVLPQRKKETR